MVAINVVPEQDKDVSDWRKKGGYTFPILLSESGFAETNYGVDAEPTNLLLDSDYRMVFRHLGYGSGGEKQMEAEIRELLGLDPFEGIETTTATAPKDGARSGTAALFTLPGSGLERSDIAASATPDTGTMKKSTISDLTPGV